MQIKSWYSIFFAILLLGLFCVSYTQNRNGVIRGIIIDSKTHLPLEGANIVVKEKNIYTTSDKHGMFEINQLIEGENYVIEISYVGYKKISINLKAKEKNSKELYVLHMDMIALELKEAVVSGRHANFIVKDKDELFKTLNSFDLTKELGMTLASTLSNMATVSIRSMGPTTARPVLRGFGSDRIKILEDGIVATDLSSTSPDHAVALDPTNAEKIEIIGGPKVLLYSPSISGGAVNIEKNSIPFENHASFHGEATSFFESVNSGILTSANLKYPICDVIIAKSEITYKTSDDLYTPKGYLKNTQSKIINFQNGIAINSSKFKIGGSYGELRMDYGIPGGFLGAHLYGADIKVFKRKFNIKSIYSIKNDEDFLSLNYINNYYKHYEYEDKSFIGATFKIKENALDLKLNFKSEKYYVNNLILGLNSVLKENFYGGYVFTPSARTFSNSIYFYGEKKFNLFETQISGRANYDEITPFKEKFSRIGHIKKKYFFSYSGAFAIQNNIFMDFYLGTSISLNSKIPTVDELFSEGPHLAAYSYEIGNPTLKPEQGIGNEIFFYWLRNKDKVMLNLYFFDYDKYILSRKTGDTNWATLLPIYRAGFVKARLYGFEFILNKNFDPFNFNFFITNSRGINLTEKLNLPMIPPIKGRTEISYSDSRKLQVNYSLNFAAEQKKVDKFETKTKGYLIHNITLRYQLINTKIIHIINITLENILNSSYRNHLSRTKDYFPEAGRNLKIIYKVNF